MAEYSNNIPVVPAVVVEPAAEVRAPAPASDGSGQLGKLKAVLQRFEVHIADANDLVALQEYQMVIIADDSGSMSLPAQPPNMRKLGQTAVTRWEELKETTSFIVDIAASFDSAGVDIFFLNRAKVAKVTSSSDRKFEKAFQAPPAGSTPLTDTVRSVAAQCEGEKPVLLFIMTDGVPNGGPLLFANELRRLVRKESTHTTFKVQIMACTGNEDETGYLNDLDHELKEVDVTDDYYTESAQVIRAGLTDKFSRGDWCMKAMLGPVTRKFDKWDERTRNKLFASKTAFLEGACGCKDELCVIS